MIKKDLSKLIMNPVRLRIIQYLLLNECGTTSDIKHELKDIPLASLYRHIKMLEKAELIIVMKETKIRGTVEKTYQINKDMNLNSEDQVLPIIQTGLLNIMNDFNRYFAKEEKDPQKDMLFLSTSALLLSDEEFTQFTEKLGAIFSEVINNKKTDERKVRRITFISSPAE